VFALGCAVAIVVLIDGKISRRSGNRKGVALLKVAIPGIGLGFRFYTCGSDAIQGEIE